MPTTGRTTAVAAFARRQDAERAVDDLRQAGFTDDDIAIRQPEASARTAGAMLGALTGMGVPEQEAAYFAERFRAGQTILTVRAGERREEARAIMRRHNGATAEDEVTTGHDAVWRFHQPVYGAEEVRRPREYEAGYSTARMVLHREQGRGEKRHLR